MVDSHPLPMEDSRRLKHLLALSLVVMMLGMTASLSIKSDYSQSLAEIDAPKESHLNRNYPGSTAGSIYSISTILAGWNTSCVVMNNHAMKCWGDGGMGRLGNGQWNNRADPVSVNLGGNGGSTNAAEVSQGLSHHYCAVMTDGTMQCWGEDYWGQNGHGSGGGWHGGDATPVQVTMPTGRTAVTVANGFHHSCAIMDDYSLYCWGDNRKGQLGTGSTTGSTAPGINTPTLITLPANKTAIAASGGYDASCIILNDFSGMCTGYNDDGQLGIGNTSNMTSFTEISVLPANSNLVAISMGVRHTCGLLDNGSVYCWGWGSSGQLGDGTTETRNNSSVQVQLPAGRTAIAIDSGMRHTCAVLDDDSAVCWGRNELGQIGDNTTTDRTTPTTVLMPAGLGVATISAGRDHTCAIATNGSVWCWGAYQNGQLGNGWTTDSDIPLYVDIGSYHAKLGERDHDDDGILNIFDDTPYPPPTCPRGQYVVGYECFDADPGHYTPTSGMDHQLECPVGTYQPDSGQDHCLDASRGHYADANASVNQTACLPGTYQNQTGQTSCIDSAAGYFTNISAAEEPVACDIGSYQPATGQTECQLSDPGHYVDATAQTDQTACVAGMFQPDAGQESCILASLGYYVADSGSESQTECPAGTYAGERGLTACVDADPGHFVAAPGASGQTSCGPGEYQPQSAQTSCLITEAGYHNPDFESTDMIPCEAGYYQHEEGRTYCLAADIGYYAPAPATVNQIACPEGTYSVEEASTSCTDADAGWYVPDPASSEQMECQSGTYSAAPASTECTVAEAGHYVISDGATEQVACEPGTYQSEAGATGCVEADEGYYVESSAGTEQVACAEGTYQSDSGESECIVAPAGTYAVGLAATNLLNCAPGEYQPEEGQGSCLEAEAGHHVFSHGATEQIPCDAGTYQPETGQSDCETASPGNHVPSPGSSDQTPCSLGTYQPLFGEDECREASKDHFVESAGSTKQMPCPAGTSQPNTGQASCITDEDDSLPILPIAGGAVVLLALVGFMLTRGKGEPEVPEPRRRRPPQGARRRKKRPRPPAEPEATGWERPFEDGGEEE